MSAFPNNLGMAMALPPKAGGVITALNNNVRVGGMEDEMSETPEHESEEAAAVTITPEAVCYRDGQQVCSTCQYLEESGECQPLKIIVDPGGGCNLHKERGA
ncbi:MAG: hypothetical protein EBR82_07290 [Caulobacteraceae bacterium]|nr:hypothetical protein [Caulobacteraceae bacterium]